MAHPASAPTNLSSLRAVAWLAAVLAALPALAQTRSIRVPADIGEADLARRREAQLETVDDLDTFLFFRFDDRLAQSGITWRHHITDDAGRHYKMVHYDHGNGLAAADVDGDGREDLYFVNQLGPSALYLNLGGGRFRDVTDAAGIALPDRIKVTASFADYDNDGDADLFVTTVRMGNVLFRNDGKGVFTDVTKEAGVGYSGHSSGAVFLDYDRDGLLDLFVTNVGVYTSDQKGHGGYYVGLDGAFTGHLHSDRSEASLLYRNTGGGRFADVSKEVLAHTGWSGDATATDFDQDGLPELYVLSMQGDDLYYENRGGQRFVENTAPYFPKTPWGAMGVTLIDLENDGRLDLYVTDMHSDMTEDIGPEKEKLKATESVMREWGDEHLLGGANNVFGNAFYRNLGAAPSGGGPRFEEISDRIGVETYWPWGVSAGDLNADGFEDLYVTGSMNYPFRYGIDSLLVNEGGKRFVDAEFILGVEPREELVEPWFELECGGADTGHAQCQGRTGETAGKVTILGTAGSRASVLLDLDADGDLDVVTSDFNSSPRVLVSDLAAQTNVNFLAVDLRGTRANRDGLGATVSVHAGGRSFTRYHNGKSGYLSQSSLPLYFGLGDAQKVDRVEVRWPSGKVQTVSGDSVAIDSRIEIVEDGATSVVTPRSR